MTGTVTKLKRSMPDQLARPRGAEPIVGAETTGDDGAMDGVFVDFLAMDAIPWISSS